MKIKSYRRSLSRRITLTFVLLGFIIATVFSLGVVFTIHYTERHLVLLNLGRDLNRIVATVKNGDVPTMDHARFFYDDKAKGATLPEWLRDSPEGYSERRYKDNWYHVVSRERDGHHYVIIQRQNDFEKRERRIHRIVIACWFLSLLIAFLSARILVRMAILPVRRLATQVNDVQSGAPYSPLGPAYPNDEVGTLARAFDSTFTQMSSLLQREREFTSAVSHELRSPLMVEQGALELINMTELTPQQKELVKRMERAHNQMGELVGAFLLLARERKGELANVPCARLADIAHIQLEYWRASATNRKLEFHINELVHDETLYPAPLLHSVFGNLFRNAVHYSSPGSITVNLGMHYFEIIDQAPSISPDTLDHLFQPFVRGTTEGNGLGLGLSIVRRICAFLDWQLTHQGVNGVNCFRVDLSGYPPPNHTDGN